MTHVSQRQRPGRRPTPIARNGPGRPGTGRRITTPEGDPGPALAGVASRETDLIVVGREHVASWPGLHHAAVSDYLTGHARCPVVVVPTMSEASS
jgi:hypothetical protein